MYENINDARETPTRVNQGHPQIREYPYHQRYKPMPNCYSPIYRHMLRPIHPNHFGHKFTEKLHFIIYLRLSLPMVTLKSCKELDRSRQYLSSIFSPLSALTTSLAISTKQSNTTCAAMLKVGGGAIPRMNSVNGWFQQLFDITPEISNTWTLGKCMQIGFLALCTSQTILSDSDSIPVQIILKWQCSLLALPDKRFLEVIHRSIRIKSSSKQINKAQGWLCGK